MLTSSSSTYPSPLLRPESSTVISVLQRCLDLAKDPKTTALADETYHQLRDRLQIEGTNDQILRLLDLLWESNRSSQRAAAMWQHMCHTEQQLTDQMAESHVQLHQNYLRLIQEQ